jgi:anti-sigma factor ChrR (cupin superfamily)
MYPEAAPIVFTDLAAMACRPDLEWEPFRPGIEIVRLYSSPTEAASAFLRYAPGASLGRHVHRGWEHIFVLSGSQTDDHGHHRAGAMLVHPPGSTHATRSEEGCIVLAVWEKPVAFLPESNPRTMLA